MKLKLLLLLFLTSVLSCTEQSSKQLNKGKQIELKNDKTDVSNGQDRVPELKIAIKNRQDAERNRKDYLDTRNQARKKFDERLTEEEKLVISEVRENYLYGIKLIEILTLQNIEKLKETNEYTQEVELSYQMQQLRLNKMKNYIISLSDMLSIINGKMTQEIYQLSNKYYNEILRTRSQFEERIKEFYSKNAERILNDSISLSKNLKKPKNPGALVLGRMDTTMDFLIVGPNSSQVTIKTLEKRINLLEKEELRQEDFLNARNKARKNFENRLIESEKSLIDKVRRNFLTFKNFYGSYINNELKNEIQKNNGKLSEELKLRKKEHELKMNKWNNYVFGEERIYMPRSKNNRKILEDISKISNKYYGEIMKIESRYSDSIRKEFEKYTKTIKSDSIKIKTKDADLLNDFSVTETIHNINYAMDFLIVNPN